MKGRDTDTRVEAWQAIINGINGFKGKKDKYQLVPTALYNKKKFRCTESSRLQEFESELRRKGLAGSHKIETIKHVKFQTGDGSKHSIFKYKFGNWRVLFSFLKDEPESASKVELFYMHSVFPRKDVYEKIFVFFPLEPIYAVDYCLPCLHSRICISTFHTVTGNLT